MDCVAFNRDIEAFIAEELDDETLNAFLNHLAVCPSCAEELEINYIVHEGIARMDKRHASLNLSSAFRHNLRNNQEYIAFRRKLMITADVFRTLSFWTLAATVFVFLRILIAGS